MPHTVISVENLSKRYLLGHKSGGEARESYLALRDVIGREIREIGRETVNMLRGRQLIQGDNIEEFWALNDVSFEVKQGEVIGIIGRNGAGKSTLLKILSRIIEPTEGRVVLKGRVASLLEVGTGFHPELTGRENIYLNGAILGMTRREIRSKFDEIVAFAEVEKFLDTPVKRYSSGMYVRLAFAVAAHLDPEILVVDEVLAVGDAEFQQKCLGKMSDVARESRTILFVSHNMAAVRALTRRCMLLDRGRIISEGDTESVITDYLSRALDAKKLALQFKDLDPFRRWCVEDHPAKIMKIEIDAPTNERNALPPIPFGSKLTFVIEVEVYRPLTSPDWGIGITNSRGERVTQLVRSDYGSHPPLETGIYSLTVSVADLPLTPGRYCISAWFAPIVGGETSDVIYDYPLFTIVKEDHIDHYQPPYPWGAVFCNSAEWAVVKTPTRAAAAAENI
jgi:lipopolysaccharide transport system ATP-binding protein